jgi:hypothetical protein
MVEERVAGDGPMMMQCAKELDLGCLVLGLCVKQVQRALQVPQWEMLRWTLCMMLCCTLLYCTVLYSIVLYSTAHLPTSEVLRYTILS